jgi:c-di-GMP-binding flagellar brake protein YcgR
MMTHSPENSPFAIHNHKEIVFIFEDLVKNKTAINLDTQEGAGLITSVLEISAQDDYLHMDVSPDPKVNDKIRASKRITFSTQFGVKVRWYATHLQLVTLSDGDAFSMAIPEVIERIQRREYFRLETPQGSKALICKIPLEDGVVEAALEDLSVGGIGLAVKGKPHPIFSQGATLDGCSIDLPGVGPVTFRLRICGIYATTQLKSGEQMYHIGMEFVNLSRGAEGVIQRQMAQLERDRIVLK